jgi:Holliday junction resolvasome RuvABC endonuclease subunit
MILLALDPSSTCTGYAVLSRPGARPAVLVDAGRLTPAQPRAKAAERIASMVEQVADLIREHAPTHAVVELPSAHVHRGKRAGGGAGLAIYGMAVGAVWQAVLGRVGGVALVDANLWTGRVNKAVRARRIQDMGLGYRMDQDPGLDGADAIGLGLWACDHPDRLVWRVAESQEAVA